MSITRGPVGSIVRGFNTTVTAALSGYSTGNLILLASGCVLNTGAVPGTPGGWNKVPTSHITHTVLYYLIASSGSITIPGLAWSDFCWAAAWAISGQQASIPGIILGNSDAENSQTKDGGPTTSSFTPTASNAYVVHLMNKNKTSASDSTSFTPTTGFSTVLQSIGTSTRPAVFISDQIQGSASAVNTSMATGSVADATAQATDGLKVAFAAAAGAAFAPYPSPIIQRIYEPVYVHD